MVVVLFWKLQFPMHAHSYRRYEPKILGFTIIIGGYRLHVLVNLTTPPNNIDCNDLCHSIGLFIPLPNIVLSLSFNKYSLVPALYPRTKCLPKDLYINFYYLNGFGLLQSITVSLLIVKLTQFHKVSSIVHDVMHNCKLCYCSNNNF